MTFIWPQFLWLLLALPALVLLYLWLLKKKRRHTVRLASVNIAKLALGQGPGWRRHVPPALLLVAVVAGLIAVARRRRSTPWCCRARTSSRCASCPTRGRPTAWRSSRTRRAR